MSLLATPISPIIAVDRSAGPPLHQQVYDGYREAILRGDLRPGQKIPSSRELASQIQISRFPVLHAYAQLLAEGYFDSQVGSGTFISATLPEQMMSSDRHANGRPAILSGRRTVSRRTMLYPQFEWDAHLRGWAPLGCISLPSTSSRFKSGLRLWRVTAGILMRARFTTSIHSAPSAFVRKYAPTFALREPLSAIPLRLWLSRVPSRLSISLRVFFSIREIPC